MKAEEILKKVIPNYKNIPQWKVILFKDCKDNFSEKILQAMKEYAKIKCEEQREKVREGLLKQLHPMIHKNGYPSEAVPKATILEIVELINEPEFD